MRWRMGSSGVGSRSRRRLTVAGFLTLTGLLTAAGCTEVQAPHETDTATVKAPAATPTATEPPTVKAPAAIPTATESPTPTTEPPTPPVVVEGETLQLGNDLPRTRLETKQSRELADNRIGAVAHLPYSVDLVTSTGLKWMRLAPDPTGRWQHVDWAKDEYAVDPEEEREIDELVSNGVKIMLVLSVWFDEDWVVYYKSEEDVERYLNWVRFMVRHFKGRIDYYEILNEPDLNFEAPSGLPLDAYVKLIKRTVPIIRAEDPQAKIVVGALPYTLWDHVRDYMWGLLKSEVMPLVDGFSWHPMYGAAPADDPRSVSNPREPQMANYWENYPALVEEIMRVAESSGFAGEYIVEEMGWRTPLEPVDHDREPYGFTPLSSAKYYARAIIIHLGLNILTGVGFVEEEHGGRAHPVIRALATVMAGAEPVDLPVVLETEATNIRHYAFALPNGDKLLALWTDGAAVDEDPGINATLTFPGLSGRSVVGLDVLYGFQQELTTELENGNLVIRDLLVKDYPTILRLRR